MKKPKVKGKSPSSAPRKARGKGASIDPEMMEELRQFLLSAMVREEASADDDPVEQFREYLSACAAAGETQESKQAQLDQMLPAMTSLQIGFDHGEAEAEKAFAEIEEMLGESIDDDDLSPTDLMLTAKMFAEAKFDPPARLKAALAQAFNQPPPPDLAPDSDASDPRAFVTELAESVGDDPFEMNEQLSALLAGFPSEITRQLLYLFADQGHAVGLHCLAGFLLHADPEIAATASGALTVTASTAPVESLLIERIVRMRPWLTAERQPPLDAVIKALRQNAAAPEKRAETRPITIRLSVSDGAGGRSLTAMVRVERKYAFLTVLITRKGVRDAIVQFDVSKTEGEMLVEQVNESVTSAVAGIDAASKMLALSLADNLKTATPPPFKLIQVAEFLGLGALPPDSSAPENIVGELIAGLPAELTDDAATRRAHHYLSAERFPESWFEDGKAVENLLRSRRGFGERVRALLKDILPARRVFWARQCALSALAMRGLDAEHPPIACIEFALVGRDLASDKPVDQLPLLRAIAEQSARAYKQRWG
jgi:hypothetical protein